MAQQALKRTPRPTPIRALRDAARLKPDTPVTVSAGVLADIAARLSAVEGIEDAAEAALIARILQEDQDAEAWPDAVMERLLNDENALKVIREWRGLTQTEVARKAKLSQSYLAELERGKTATVPTLRRLAGALNVEIDDLITP
ncbi:MAG: helix-turn-helix transcriptional regulator [Rhodospirillaceae bacterium]|nr:helix-turn-helix transcriptional regulator [Rhodospirillaceae bacterium]